MKKLFAAFLLLSIIGCGDGAPEQTEFTIRQNTLDTSKDAFVRRTYHIELESRHWFRISENLRSMTDHSEEAGPLGIEIYTATLVALAKPFSGNVEYMSQEFSASEAYLIMKAYHQP